MKTVLTALDVMEYLGERAEPVRLTDISRALALPKGQVHRILATLASRNYVQQEPDTRQYYLGFKVWLLGQNISPGRAILNVAQPLLDRLCNDVQESVFLAVLDGDSSIYLYARDGAHPIRASFRIGTSGPLHATPTGKAMLAYQTQEYLDSFLTMDLTRFTEHTIVDRTHLLRELDEVRSQGYAVTVDEWCTGLAGVAAPILGKSQQVFASAGISFPTSRGTEECTAKMGKLAQQVAQEISRQLGS